MKTADGNMCECRARGILRKRGQKPVAGDMVKVNYENDAYIIDAILPRKNLFVRPPIANVDKFFVVVATTTPLPNTFVIDKLLAVAVMQGTDAIMLITKTDLKAADELMAIYRKSGILVLSVSVEDDTGIAEIRKMLTGGLSVFCGSSGVGKSTLLNALTPDAKREVAEVSTKLERGRHTTREVEIVSVAGGLLADSPGFSSFDLQSAGEILADNLQLCFPEIKKYIGLCKFSGCAHVAEKGCAVLDAVKNGDITQSRWRSYVAMYEQAKANEREYQ